MPRKFVALGGAMENLGPFDDVMVKLRALNEAMGEIGAPSWPDGDIGGPRPHILFKQVNTAPLHIFKLMPGPKF